MARHFTYQQVKALYQRVEKIEARKAWKKWKNKIKPLIKILNSDKLVILKYLKKGYNANDIVGLKRFSRYHRQQVAAIAAWATIRK